MSMRVVIVGIGAIGMELARNLSRRKNNEMVLVDVDEKHCDQLAADLDALVIHGDGSDPEILKKAQVEQAQALVATTGSDPINTVIAMLGRQLGVEKIIVKLKTFGLRSACREIGVNSIIAPEISAAAEIISSLYGFDRVNFSMVASGGLRLVELDISEDLGKKISSLKIPDGAHIVALLRSSQMLLPRQSLKMEKGDQLLVLIEEDSIIDGLKKQLTSDNGE